MKIKICSNCNHDIMPCDACNKKHCEFTTDCECQCWEYDTYNKEDDADMSGAGGEGDANDESRDR